MTGSRAETCPTTPAAKALAAVWFTWALLFVGLGLLAVARRLVGGYTSPPSLAALAGWSLFVAGSAAALRWYLWTTLAAAWPSAWYYTVMGGLSAALLLWSAALTVAGAPIAGLALLWALAAAEEGITWPLLARRRVVRPANTPFPSAGPDVDRRGRSAPPANADRAGEQPAPFRDEIAEPAQRCDDRPVSFSPNGSPSLAPSTLGESAEPAAGSGLPGDDRAEPLDSDAVVQQLTRTKPPGGPETIFGWLRLPLAPGQRSGALHVAFCPPLDGPPIIEFEQVDGPPARVKLSHAYAYGARFDVKLNDPADDEGDLVVRFSAASSTASPGVESAAGGG